MVTFDCSASHHDGVTLVTLSLRDLETPMRVTVRNCLDGPVWPPRTQGLPEAGWTATGFSGVLAAGAHALGYATPARPEGTPAELVDAVAVPDADPVSDRNERPADVVRDLGDPSPPADAVPAVEPATSSKPTATTSPGDDSAASPTPDSRGPPSPSCATGNDTAPANRDDDRCGSHSQGDPSATLPPALGPWLAEMERRTDAAEALATAETVPEATTAVREAGGLDEVRALADAGDERQLRLLARRVRRLADRRATVTIPVETLATLA